MAFEDFQTKESVIVVYTGDNKGKTSAAIGMTARALGNRWSVAFIQFIKYWGVGEHVFIRDITEIYKEKLYFYKGGKGFYNAGTISAADITEDQHKTAAQTTFDEAYRCATSGTYDLVVCDEINNALHDGLISRKQFDDLINDKATHTSLCLTGRDFPDSLLEKVDIATNMTKLKHHFDDNFIANKGIDF